MSVVSITVNPPDSAGRYSLHHYPRRSGDVVVYRAKPNKPEVPGLVREVIWTAFALQSDHKLEIREKGRGQSKGHFQGVPLTLTKDKSLIQSGRPVKGPPPGKDRVTWSYDIVLVDANGVELAWVDPEVIIIDDP